MAARHRKEGSSTVVFISTSVLFHCIVLSLSYLSLDMTKTTK